MNPSPTLKLVHLFKRPAKFIHAFLLLWGLFFVPANVLAKDLEDSVYAKVGEKVYFTSDFVHLQQAMGARLCADSSKVAFIQLIESYLQEKKNSVQFTREKLMQAQLHQKKTELEALIVVFKMLQILVDQQVSFQASAEITIPAHCLEGTLPASKIKIQQLYQKLVYLDDLLIVKSGAEKDLSKKKSALLNIVDSMDKQIKHIIMVDLP